MRLDAPAVNVPGDNAERIMARSGACVGADPARSLAVWRFGFLAGSESARMFGVHIEDGETDGFLWVLTPIEGEARWRRSSPAAEYGVPDAVSFRGYAANLPERFEAVIDS